MSFVLVINSMLGNRNKRKIDLTLAFYLSFGWIHSINRWFIGSFYKVLQRMLQALRRWINQVPFFICSSCARMQPIWNWTASAMSAANQCDCCWLDRLSFIFSLFHRVGIRILGRVSAQEDPNWGLPVWHHPSLHYYIKRRGRIQYLS